MELSSNLRAVIKEQSRACWILFAHVYAVPKKTKFFTQEQKEEVETEILQKVQLLKLCFVMQGNMSGRLFVGSQKLKEKTEIADYRTDKRKTSTQELTEHLVSVSSQETKT